MEQYILGNVQFLENPCIVLDTSDNTNWTAKIIT